MNAIPENAMSLVRTCALVAALPLLAGCIVGYSESSRGTVIYPAEVVESGAVETPDSYGTGVERPTGQASRVYYDEVQDPYQQAVQCAASQEALLRMDTYMVTRQNLYDMQDSIWMWTNLAIERGAERGITEAQTRNSIARMSQALKGREANRVALGCVNAPE